MKMSNWRNSQLTIKFRNVKRGNILRKLKKGPNKIVVIGISNKKVINWNKLNQIEIPESRYKLMRLSTRNCSYNR